MGQGFHTTFDGFDRRNPAWGLSTRIFGFPTELNGGSTFNGADPAEVGAEAERVADFGERTVPRGMVRR